MATKAPRYSLILAAGKGTRMGFSTTPKVCFPVDGVPVINRALDIYRRCGIKNHIVVVGSLAGAGLGGCMMVMAHRDSVAALKKRMVDGYYKPYRKKPVMHECRPIAGADVLMGK